MRQCVPGKPVVALVFGIGLLPLGLEAQTNPPVASADQLKRLSLEELMNVDVTSVSRRAEPLFSTPSAIQVITQEDIRRSGASSLPEALRLAPNLQVARSIHGNGRSARAASTMAWPTNCW